jgi:hypothetical protein
MKTTLIFILIFYSINLSANTRSFNSKGIVERTNIIKFNPQQISKLRSIIYDSDGKILPNQYPEAYNYIYSMIKKKNADEGTLFWFEKAARINEDVGSSSYMIRSYTTIGLKITDRDVPDLQRVSDDIARNVLTDVIKNSGVLPLQNILARDITAAMRVGNIKDLAGWGGSFYYWHMPLVNSKGKLIIDPYRVTNDDYVTVGDSILRNQDQVRRFVMTFILCVTNTPYLTVLSDTPGLFRALLAIDNLPDIVRIPIINGISAIDPIMGNTLNLLIKP